ncbi:aspartate/glutamate racemase family protein [Pseudomonas sp. dw_612]|uniref:aspartate/glutamate racemase family protein n=1 Tax=Pseudomonas sp. dw_612 TaxID=2720080 RepID=UPI001BD1EBE6|nr:aspartate/glutamate racemase family protein [Pseudomonas sp. dw_612]
MKLCWIHPTGRNPALEPLWNTLPETVGGALAQGVQLDFRFLDNSGGFTRSLYAEHLNSVLMVEAAIKAQADGYDGVFLGCWNDPLWEAREMLDIPVASVGEQSMLAALAMGQRFAVITVSEKTAAAIERDIIGYGLTDRCIRQPVRSIQPFSDVGLLLEATHSPTERFIPRLEAVARQCIADGADVILVGCAYYGPLLRRAGYRHVQGTQVPVVDSSTVALKYLEAMVGIAQCTGLVKSRANLFAGVAPAAIAQARKALGFSD